MLHHLPLLQFLQYQIHLRKTNLMPMCNIFEVECCQKKKAIYKDSIFVTPNWLRVKRGVAAPVDLGLSVLWANCNLGATSEELPGYMAGWADTTLKNNSVNTTEYPLPLNGSISMTELDAAQMLWKENWRIPTSYEMLELMQKCQWTWCERNNIPGYWVMGGNGNGIFLPACGSRYGAQYENYCQTGLYWCGDIDSNDNSRAQALEYNQHSGNIINLIRCFGACIRPVMNKM